MFKKVIQRASGRINRKDFIKLTKLCRKYDWLQDRSDALAELWNYADKKNNKLLIEFLIKNFLFVNGRNYANSCRLIANHIENKWNLSPSNTIIASICINSSPDGSQRLIQSLKNKFSTYWSEEGIFINCLPEAVKRIKSNSNIVLLDDFLGTGRTLNSRLDYLKYRINKEQILNVNIYFIALAAMNFSKSFLDNLDVKYYSSFWLYKGISELLDEPKRAQALYDMGELEKKLAPKERRKTLPNLGYGQSESLFAIDDDNIPTNVFPVFWWPRLADGHYRKTLFHRL